MTNLRRHILEVTISRKLHSTLLVIWTALLTLSLVLSRLIQDASFIDKFQHLLNRFVNGFGESNKDAIHRSRPSAHKLVNAKPQAILSIIICAILVITVYASMGASSWGVEYRTVMEMFSLANNYGSHLSPVARDSTPPMISGLADLVVEATGVLTEVSLTVPTVTDNVDPNPSVTNDARSAGYPLGTNIITWTAKDGANNTSTAVQKVTVADTSAPVITAPPDIVVHVNSSTTLIQTSLGTAIMKDSVDDSLYVTNDAPFSGFPVGVSTVTWKAVDKSGNSATDKQLVSILMIEDTSTPLYISQTSSNKGAGSQSTLPASGGSSSGSPGSSDLGSALCRSDTSDSSAAGSKMVSHFSTKPSFAANGANYCDIPYRPSLGLEKFSLAAWFKTSANYDENAMIVNKGGSGSELSGENMNYGIWMTSSERLMAGFESSNGTDYYVTNGNTYSDGRWHHAAVTYDGSSLVLYVDGAELAWRPITAIPDNEGTQPVRIGANSKAENGYFRGELDEITIWAGALTATEVADQYYTGLYNIKGYDIPSIGGVKPTSVIHGSTVTTVCDSGCTHMTIRSAIDSLPSGGGKVLLKASKTLTPQDTILLRSNIVIEFEKGAKLTYSGTGPVFSGNKIKNVMFINPVISRSDAGDVLYFSKAENVIIQGGKITGVKGSSSSGFKCDSCKNVLVQGGTYSVFSRPIDVGTISATTDGTTRNVWLVGNTIFDSSIECVHLNSGYDMHAISNNVRDCANNGIDVGYNIGVEANYNKLTRTGYGGIDNAVGIHTDSSDTVVLLENIIDITGTDGISVCGSDNNYVIGNWISNTGRTLAHNTGNGIEVIKCGASSELVPENTIIDGNHITKTLDTGIYITQQAIGVYITNNTIGNFGTKVIFDNSNKATITANIIL